MNLRMDSSDRAKLFVGGISRETTEQVLRDHFARYGAVLDSTVSLDRITRSPRGFGFVTFSDLSSADRALHDTHVILGRTVEVKKAIPRSEQHQQNHVQNRAASNYSSNDCSNDHFRTKKIFVGGLSAGISEEEFKRYFERFGRITDVVVMQDSLTHRPRGFGFITFDSEESVQNVMVRSFHDLNGRQVEVKRAIPKEGNHGHDGLNKSRYRNEREATKTLPLYSPSYTVPGFAPQPWYGGNGVYVYGSSNYGWYPMGGDGYGGNGYAVPSDFSRNFWYGPTMGAPQACQVPYANVLPSVAYMGGRVAVGGDGADARGNNGILGSATNLKYDQPFPANGFVPGNVTSPQGMKQDVDSSSYKRPHGEFSS